MKKVLILSLALTACTSVSTPAPDSTAVPVVRGAFDIDVTGTKFVDVALPTDTGIAAAKVAGFVPGHAFQITGVSSFTRAKSGTVTGSVKIDTTTVATLTFGADSVKASTLTANVQGSSTQTVYVILTTTGAGILSQGHVTLKLKPRY